MNRDYSAAPSTAGTGGRPQAGSGAMFYLCAECGAKVGINKGEHIRCKECGHRVLYKQRTKRMVQFEAR
ncbi:DNA-directed RNA polymerases I, II, and III subunit RPABC4 [Kalaharituber pfeilii]|nr:DNA-directed RNA polymerases I, II, and III subunit RPABC4 [Kalaharituber pfeilii]